MLHEQEHILQFWIFLPRLHLLLLFVRLVFHLPFSIASFQIIFLEICNKVIIMLQISSFLCRIWISFYQSQLLLMLLLSIQMPASSQRLLTFIFFKTVSTRCFTYKVRVRFIVLAILLRRLWFLLFVEKRVA